MALTNAQYDEIMRQYNQRQIQAQNLADVKKAALYKEDPRFAQLDQEIASDSIAKTRCYIDGQTEVLQDLEADIARLSIRRQELLAEHGYAPDYFDPVYTCPDCKDTGYINGKKCHCFEQASVDYVYAQSNLRAVLKEENFSTFSFKYYAEDNRDPASGMSSLELAKHAVVQCQSFLKHFSTEHPNLLLYGNTGVGKTFLTNCMAKELLDHGASVIYFSAFQLFDILAKNIFGKKGERSNDYQNIFNCDLLIIDDLGTEVPNSFTISQFFQCLNERQLRGRSTIISTNLNLRDIAEIYSERIASRITSNFNMVKLYGEDIRIMKKLKE